MSQITHENAFPSVMRAKLRSVRWRQAWTVSCASDCDRGIGTACSHDGRDDDRLVLHALTDAAESARVDERKSSRLPD